ncbi:MAG: pyrroline-5-carboxylate reductase [Proteobacteria bacterium]|nr:pyrroline-5-carboxylate reductase [Pseudomonadota bacterium]
MTASIGFIGLGNMGAAMVRGLTGVSVHGADLNREFLESLRDDCGLIPANSITELAETCDYLVLAVKPQHAKSVCDELAPVLQQSQCLLSICAGLTSQRLKEWTGSTCPVVRIMPNTPALVGEGVFAVCLDDESLTFEQKSFVGEIFKSLGQVHIMPETSFDAFTAVIGSGPAYVCYFIEALIESAVELGLARPQATEMVYGLFSGTTKMCIQSDKHVSQLREMVTSPAGTTIEALIHMDRQAVRASIIDAAKKSFARSVELGK